MLNEPDVREIADPFEGQQAIDQIGRLCVYRSGRWHLMENMMRD